MFHVELAPLGGILGPLKSDLGVFWAKIPLYPYNVKFSKSIFSKSANLPILSFWILNLHIINCQFPKRPTVKHFFSLSPCSCHLCGLTLPPARIIQQLQIYLIKILLTYLTVSWEEIWFYDFWILVTTFIYDPVRQRQWWSWVANFDKFGISKILLLQKWNYKIWACGEVREPMWSCNIQLSSLADSRSEIRSDLRHACHPPRCRNALRCGYSPGWVTCVALGKDGNLVRR